MAITVNTNVSSLISQRYLTNSTNSLSATMQKLSSGYRINSAKDDAAGLSIAQNMTTQIRGNEKALENIADALNLVSTAETGLDSTTEHLQRIRELCVQAASDVYTTTQKSAIMLEITQRLTEIDRLAEAITFNGKILLHNEDNDQIYIQIGSGSDIDVNTIEISSALSNIKTSALGVYLSAAAIGTDPNADIITTDWTSEDFRDYMEKIDVALEELNYNRSRIGALSNTMESACTALTMMNEKVSSTKSRIMDTDIAEATADLTKYQILQQCSTSILTQANQLPSLALSLLGS